MAIGRACACCVHGLILQHYEGSAAHTKPVLRFLSWWLCNTNLSTHMHVIPRTMKTSYLGNLARGNSAWKSIHGCCHSPICQALPILSCVCLSVPLPMTMAWLFHRCTETKALPYKSKSLHRKACTHVCCGLGPMQHGLSYSSECSGGTRACSKQHRMHVLHHPLGMRTCCCARIGQGLLFLGVLC